ncbi:hypothetical protein [Sinorhizobium meliloti]|uniref:hypothetical protein n=1 Tax=Rhizobium meliloti TaxID=382 RepID=UPI000FDB4375|nr:hypothetical protein [Sinorhizobium meliloti]MDW9766671.1 hypothetical protein [Sinorhizobium meliloti]MDW9989258.1 hypothetical protein [Sinorhizobium meliloti]MDX0243559.1 hypothetical protein [Sinorhizobium meliloti]MDX0399604.1 hypothetical protein [Sinorhizobium meliloti]RVP10707.1 hypothetical protein CN083_03935 [Sinorhizobium meliloti]
MDDTDLGVKYEGFDLALSEAQTLASFYKSRTNYQLAQSDRVSLLSTELSPESVRAYVECLKNTKTNITIQAPDGAEFAEAFQIIVKWHPQYTVQVVDGKTERPVNVNITNGSLASSNDKIIQQQGQVTFNVLRPDLDKPLYITASVDNQESDFFTFPPIARSKMIVSLLKAERGPIKRSGHYGNTPVAVNMCLEPEGGGILLPSTARATVTGAGHEWEQRSKNTLLENNNQFQVCSKLWTGGVPCNEDACYHETTGQLSVLQAYINPNP